MKNFDYAKSYYIVFRNGKESAHRYPSSDYQDKTGLTWRYKFYDGLNVDYCDFKKPNSGFEFYDENNVMSNFCDMDSHIREIEIPKDAKIKKSENGWKANKVILKDALSEHLFYKKQYQNYITNKNWGILCRKYSHKFFEWWNPDKFNYKNHSYGLAKYCNAYFKNWWNPDKFFYSKDSTIALIKNCSAYFKDWWKPEINQFDNIYYYFFEYAKDYFEIWWDADKIDWKKYSEKLCTDYYEYIKIWWDADKFNWDKISALICYCNHNFHTWWIADKIDVIENEIWLTSYCNDYFNVWWNGQSIKSIHNFVENCIKDIDKWWNSELINWKDKYVFSEIWNKLTTYGSPYIKIWFDKDKFNWNFDGGLDFDNCYHHLIKNCANDFDVWWNPKTFNWKYGKFLACYCSKHIKKWWNPKKFKKEDYMYLYEHCMKQKKIWHKDVMEGKNEI